MRRRVAVLTVVFLLLAMLHALRTPVPKALYAVQNPSDALSGRIGAAAGSSRGAAHSPNTGSSSDAGRPWLKKPYWELTEAEKAQMMAAPPFNLEREIAQMKAKVMPPLGRAEQEALMRELLLALAQALVLAVANWLGWALWFLIVVYTVVCWKRKRRRLLQ